MRRRLSLALCAAAGLALVSCSSVPEGAIEAEALECPPGEEGCDEIKPVGEGGELHLEAGNFYFEELGGIAVTGEVVVTLENVSDAYHNAEFLGAAEGSEIPEAEPFETGEGTVLLFPGEWTVICNVPGHRAAGMETTITVYATPEEAAQAQQQADEDGSGQEA